MYDLEANKRYEQSIKNAIASQKSSPLIDDTNMQIVFDSESSG